MTDKMNYKRQWVMQNCEEIALWEGFDSALLGVASRCSEKPVALYDLDLMIKHLRKEMTEEEAQEHLEFNVLGAYMGPLTPWILNRIPRRVRLSEKLDVLASATAEIERLRNALSEIATMKDEPYSSEFAREILDRRTTL